MPLTRHQSHPRPHDTISTQALDAIFDRMDHNKDGSLTIEELEVGASHLFLAGAAMPRRKVAGRLRADTATDFLRRADKDGDGRISRTEFINAIREQELLLWNAFQLAGTRPSKASLLSAFAPYFADAEQLREFVAEADAALSGSPLTYARFQAWVKQTRLQFLTRELEKFRTLDTGFEGQQPVAQERAQKGASGATIHSLHLFGAGLLAGAISRTATAPGERIKVMRATGQLPGAPTTWGAVLREIVAREGVVTFWRGNLANVLKVAPAKGVKFLLFESCVQGRLSAVEPTSSLRLAACMPPRHPPHLASHPTG